MDWRVFYAHPKKTGRDIDADVEVIRRQLQTALKRSSIEGTVQVTSGRDDFRERSDGWREWPASVTERVYGEARYNLIVVCAVPGSQGNFATIGKGTWAILDAAEARSVPIRLWHGMDVEWEKNQTFRRCAPVETINPNDWQTGWRLRASDWTEPQKAVYRDWRGPDTDDPY